MNFPTIHKIANTTTRAIAEKVPDVVTVKISEETPWNPNARNPGDGLVLANVVYAGHITQRNHEALGGLHTRTIYFFTKFAVVGNTRFDYNDPNYLQRLTKAIRGCLPAKAKFTCP